MERKNLSCVYFPEVDRFLIACDGKSTYMDTLLRSRWYSSLEYFRYFPDSEISFDSIDGFLKKYPQELCCEITNKCNFTCPICIADSQVESNTQMPIDLYAKVLKDRPRTVKRITLTGGEPTLNPCLPEMLAQAVGTLKGTVLSTNGFLPNKLEEALRNNSNIIVNISLHGYKDVHDNFVGRKYAYNKALESIQVANSYTAAIHIHTTIVPETVKGLSKLCAVLCELPITEHRLNIVKPYGRQSVAAVPYGELRQFLVNLKVPYKISIKKRKQPFLFVSCEGKKEIRNVRRC